MLDLPSAAELKKTQDIIAAVPKGPWPIEAPDPDRLPDQVGPVCFVETWVDADRVPVLQFIEHAREALPRYMGAVSRQQDVIRELERRIRRLELGNGGDPDAR